MKKFTLIVLVLIIGVIGTVSCGTVEKNVSVNQEDQDIMKGYIIEKKEQRILVVQNVTGEDVKTKSVHELLQKAKPDAIWFKVIDTDLYESLQIGEIVTVKYDGIILSFPGQGLAEEIIRDKQ